MEENNHIQEILQNQVKTAHNNNNNNKIHQQQFNLKRINRIHNNTISINMEEQTIPSKEGSKQLQIIRWIR